MQKPVISNTRTEAPSAVEPDIDDLSLTGTSETGVKGGEVNKERVAINDQPMPLVDYLWKHRND